MADQQKALAANVTKQQMAITKDSLAHAEKTDSRVQFAALQKLNTQKEDLAADLAATRTKAVSAAAASVLSAVLAVATVAQKVAQRIEDRLTGKLSDGEAGALMANSGLRDPVRDKAQVDKAAGKAAEPKKPPTPEETTQRERQARLDPNRVESLIRRENAEQFGADNAKLRARFSGTLQGKPVAIPKDTVPDGPAPDGKAREALERDTSAPTGDVPYKTHPAHPKPDVTSDPATAPAPAHISGFTSGQDPDGPVARAKAGLLRAQAAVTQFEESRNQSGDDRPQNRAIVQGPLAQVLRTLERKVLRGQLASAEDTLLKAMDDAGVSVTAPPVGERGKRDPSGPGGADPAGVPDVAGAVPTALQIGAVRLPAATGGDRSAEPVPAIAVPPVVPSPGVPPPAVGAGKQTAPPPQPSVDDGDRAADPLASTAPASRPALPGADANVTGKRDYDVELETDMTFSAERRKVAKDWQNKRGGQASLGSDAERLAAFSEKARIHTLTRADLYANRDLFDPGQFARAEALMFKDVNMRFHGKPERATAAATEFQRLADQRPDGSETNDVDIMGRDVLLQVAQCKYLAAVAFHEDQGSAESLAMVETTRTVMEHLKYGPAGDSLGDKAMAALHFGIGEAGIVCQGEDLANPIAQLIKFAIEQAMAAARLNGEAMDKARLLAKARAILKQQMATMGMAVPGNAKR